MNAHWKGFSPGHWKDYRTQVRVFSIDELRTMSSEKQLLDCHEDCQLIRRYAKHMKAGSRFPMIEVVKQGAKFLITDGNHRFLAWKSLRYRTIPAVFILARLNEN